MNFKFHSVELLFDGFNEFELCMAAVEVMIVAVSFEVDIAVEVIGEEADTDFHGNEFTCEGEIFEFDFIEEAVSACEVSAEEGFKHFETHGDFAQIDFIFESGAGTGTDHIAEVIMSEAGHDGIEVDDADTFAGEVIDENVIEFCIVMSYAFGDEALSVEFEEDAAIVTA